MNEYVSVVRGVGGHLPARVLTNADLGVMVDTSDQWITERTGIRKRHIAADGETTSDLAAAAARKALHAGGLGPDDIDLIVLATATPDYTFPATATIVQNKLGITRGAAFDVQAVCSGFVYALATADNFLARGQFERALVIGAETFSRIIDWSDRTTCVLFGDGAGALVLERQDKAIAGDRGVKSVHLRSDGRYKDMLYVDGGPSTTQTVGHLKMIGNQVFKHAVSKISESVRAAVDQAGRHIDEVDWFVPHQANMRINQMVAHKLGVPEDKVVHNIQRYGNTTAATIPIGLSESFAEGKLCEGTTVLSAAFGSGFTWAGAVMRF